MASRKRRDFYVNMVKKPGYIKTCEICYIHPAIYEAATRWNRLFTDQCKICAKIMSTPQLLEDGYTYCYEDVE